MCTYNYEVVLISVIVANVFFYVFGWTKTARYVGSVHMIVRLAYAPIIKWDDKGLAVAIAQNVDTGAILMQGFINRDALATTISSRKATFFSRSRATLWTKGETSDNFINIHDIFVDCDRDSIIYHGKPDGPTCHTGSET
ncbi:Histidine biosynthesis bifunctional protein hisIE [Hibiscus syriacus]|uniref:phosphoribosyl-AMP cyclohydrolase n=1 Tax=Hibiscus syriacus TaxID=106335 RepID=A0A6A3C812_HIBSY|nr:Histidine biosynthesis bifunctional protein hisIE [Hibiscus syriacus]